TRFKPQVNVMFLLTQAVATGRLAGMDEQFTGSVWVAQR
ncbi:MAG: hypothetical protein ACI80I_003361, partial [Akkermansiaceae bacterium]